MTTSLRTLALLFLALPQPASSDSCRQLAGDDLLSMRATSGRGGGGSEEVLVLFHAAAVNSQESEAALETWQQLTGPLTGFAQTATINCDDYPADCRALQVAHFPQAALVSGGEVLFYKGPMTAKALFLFVTNNVYSPVYQLSAKKIDWWLESEVEHTRKPVLLMHDKPQLPAALAGIARSLSSSHAFAELRLVPEAVRERFRVASLPALVMGETSQGPFTLFEGEFKRGPLRAFLTGKANAQTRVIKEDDGIAPAEDYGMLQLGAESEGGTVCSEGCTVVFIPHGKDAEIVKERRRRMAAANDIMSAMRTGKRKQSIPQPVWASTAQVEVTAAFRECAAGAEVSMAVWKAKRNRAAVLSVPLTVEAGSRFLDDILAGNGNFRALPVDSDSLLGVSKPIDREGVVPPGYLDWLQPSNILQELQGALAPPMPLPVALPNIDSEKASDTGLLL